MTQKNECELLKIKINYNWWDCCPEEIIRAFKKYFKNATHANNGIMLSQWNGMGWPQKLKA